MIPAAAAGYISGSAAANQEKKGLTKMFKAVAYYSSPEGSWHIIIGKYDSPAAAEKACYDHAKKHETDVYLQYYQVLDN